MAKARNNRRAQRRAAEPKSHLEKATAAEKRALATVAEADARLTNAIRTLVTAKSGSTKEDEAERVVRAGTKDLLRAKKMLRKAQKKRKKAAAQLNARS